MESELSQIKANDVKTRGVTAIDMALAESDEAYITVRGKNKYVVIDVERYALLNECELDVAIAEVKADIEAGRYHSDGVKKHLERIDT